VKALRLLFVDYEIPYLVKDSDYPAGPVGGAAVDLLCLIDELVAKGHRVGVLTWKGARKYLDRPTSFELIECDLRRPRGSNYLLFVLNIAQAVYHVRRFRPDHIVQKCAGGLTGIVAILARICGVPFVYRCASNVDVDGAYIGRMAAVPRWLYRHGLASARIVFCQNTAQQDGVKASFAHKQTVVIHDFYDVSCLPSAGPASERRYIAWVGRFDSYKDLPTLAGIVRAFPGLQFRIAGSANRSCDLHTRDALRELEQCHNVRFAGYLKRGAIVPFLSQAYALLNTSHVEGFPRTFLEAFAAGTPIVAGRSVDPDNIIEKNDLGVVAADSTQLGAALEALLARSDYSHFALRCRTHLREHHGAELLVSRLVEALS
jgi:glycosyltransferase involved in cell wall biosynthesis